MHEIVISRVQKSAWSAETRMKTHIAAPESTPEALAGKGFSLNSTEIGTMTV